MLGCYVVKQDDGSTVKLVHTFNPWNRETWGANPWAEGSAKWTASVKSQVNYEKANDGAFWLTADDYHKNFGITNWAEIQNGYGITWADHVFKGTLGSY